MRQILYRYNPETCQYERVRVQLSGILWYSVRVVIAAAFILGGMLMLHDFVFDSEKEIALRKENYALERNHVTLAAQLDAIESSLSRLKEKDNLLYAKFFGAPPDKSSEVSPSADENILLADAQAFRKSVRRLSDVTSSLLERSRARNSAVAGSFRGIKADPSFLKSLPTAQPINPWQLDKLISGFGMRINPFHKGAYEHPGIDIAVTRGTPVVATAPGKVRSINRSSIQAGYGNYVEIDHGSGFITRYAHLENISVKWGQQIEKGAAIGTVGSSGGSVAPHLHYEIIRDGEQVDPIPYMIDNLSPDQHHEMVVLGSKKNQSLD